QLVDPAVHLWDEHALAVQEVVEAHLVLERPGRLGVTAIASHHQPQDLAVAVDVDEPLRTPSRLRPEARHRAADIGGQPINDDPHFWAVAQHAHRGLGTFMTQVPCWCGSRYFLTDSSTDSSNVML